jgi:hypothetical protein
MLNITDAIEGTTHNTELADRIIMVFIPGYIACAINV